MKPTKSFGQKVADMESKGKFLTPGLDIELKHIPEEFMPHLKEGYPNLRLTKFICHFIDLIAPWAASVKPNLSFYEGSEGRERLENVCSYLENHYPALINLGDDKRGDIGNTNEQTVKYFLHNLGFDAITVNPLMGYKDSMQIFLEKNPDTGFFMLCLTSNGGAEDFLLAPSAEEGTRYNFQKIARFAQDTEKWNKSGNLHFVIGGTNDPEDIGSAREYAGEDSIFLMPGYGAQGGALATAKIGANKIGKKALPVLARKLITPDRLSGESYEEAVTRTAKDYHEKFRNILMPIAVS